MKIETPKSQERKELAKQFMNSYIRAGSTQAPCELAKYSIKSADALLKALEQE